MADYAQAFAALERRWLQQAACAHIWGEPRRANNRFGRQSTSLFETICTLCEKREVRNGLGRLRREVIG